ncbi:hypothetical protein GCM10023085_45260 [Actinomadura viridis]|uniref:Uncharacterized protein n=1 Tax=Actinomadura viridis TaxID=58110 RepID=A0A931DIC1_9ACTN|nr:hypothetical protein [Actinomadura viridis]MBG6089887.1 hypothetical protein [Actinomadura viridis]
MNEPHGGVASEEGPVGSEFEHMGQVDRHPGAHQATVPDEEAALRELYGEPDDDGVFRGEG